MTAQAVASAIEQGFAAYEFARTRSLAMQRTQPNTWSHRRALADHSARQVTTPNADTLYSSAWLDLSAGPVRIELPPLADGGYGSVALLDVQTDHFAVLHASADPALRSFWVVPPGFAGELLAGATRIFAPGPDAWAIGRWLVQAPEDMSAARAMQDALCLHALGATAIAEPRTALPTAPTAQIFASTLRELQTRNPRCFEGLQIPPASAFAEAGWQRAWADQMKALVAPQASPSHQGWRYPPAGIGRFGTDSALRAHIALTGLGALPIEEALYLSASTDAAGAPLSGGARYRVRIRDADFGPRAFWSLSLYELEPDGRWFFCDNPIKRHAISDRTPGVERDAQGGIEIALQVAAPESAHDRAHWLPTPLGAFSLMLRVFVPSQPLLDGEVSLPEVVRC